MFQSTSPTRFDLRFSIAGIPIRVHPLFWVIAILLGSNSNNLLMILVWIVVVFVSILVHELGHAFAFRRFGQPSNILLHFSGGLTIPESLPWGSGYATVSLTPNQHIFVSLAGPFAGFALAALTLAVGTALGGQIILSTLLGFIPFPIVLLPYGSGMLNEVFLTFLWVNVFWGIVNLLPVFPLDGGHVTRYVLIQSDPRNGLRTSLWVSVVTGGLLAVTGLLVMNSIYMAFLFGLLAFQSYQMLQGLSARRY
ncbi:MAG: site-2 protease family protein [Anaerolineales bacterium]|jgi:stage IV sporulation protein FB|uniref:site-2 protease family protein n=1 Tax=Candidatus Villigracilis vicinus TaxID=3140679 RepID=UPI0031367F6C|nr:site-2 protease family protein [Anaerolineales bacterium]MBK9778711.1 site-2 protease family protein [Anaerolineales bacterium]